MKKIFYSLLIIIALAVYIIVYKTNLVAEPVFNSGQDIKVMIEGKEVRCDPMPINDEDEIFLDINTVKDYLKMDVVWDEEKKILVYCNNDEVIRIYYNTNEIKINRMTTTINDILKMFEGTPIISSNFIHEYTDYKIKYIKESKTYIIDKTNTAMNAKVLNGTRLRKEPSIWAEVVDKINSSSDIYVYKRYNQWSYIRDEKGYFGFIKNSDYKISKTEPQIREKKVSIDKKNDGELISITWDYIGRKQNKIGKMEKIEGLDVLCPTWFSVIDEKGKIYNKASIEYTKEAHRVGYKVWGLVNNSFKPKLTSKILNDTIIREKVINNIIDLAIIYELDGINIDFENVYLKDKDMFTQFIKELYPICKEKDLKLSIDVTIKSKSENWSMFYDRVALGKVVDYMILMAYDEHWASSPTSGSVASLPWVERGLKNLLTMVDKEKVILAVPFYTRLWEEEKQGAEVKVSSRALSMKRIEDILEKKEAEVKWDDDSKQDYSEYIDGNSTYKVWLENENSLKQRIDLVKKYKIKGLASWRKGFERKEMWNVIRETLK